MAASDAVATAAVSRREVRNALDRLEYHLARGPKRGKRGIEREVALLDALHRQSVRNAGAAVGGSYRASPGQSFGRKALSALSGGSSSSIGRAKSSILADYSADVLKPARDQAARLDEWKWVTNASACPTCLSKHGKTYRGQFVPTHPSCLCIAAPADTEGLRPLSEQEIVQTHERYGLGRYDSDVRAVKEGRKSLRSLADIENVNETQRGLQAVATHEAKQEVTQTGLPGGVAPETVSKTPLDIDPEDLKTVEQADDAIRAESDRYNQAYREAADDEKSDILAAHRAKEAELQERRRELWEQDLLESEKDRLAISTSKVTHPERTWMQDMDNDLTLYSRTVKKGVKAEDWSGTYYLDLSEAGVRKRVEQTSKQFLDDMDLDLDLEFHMAFDWDTWNSWPETASRRGASAFVDDGSRVFLSPDVAIHLARANPEDFVGDLRILVHELSHSASSMKAKGITNVGLRPVMEEAGAELNSYFWAANRLSDDYIDAMTAWTDAGRLHGRDAFYWRHNYSDRVEEVILQSARRNGWDRDAMREDLLYTFRDGDDFDDFFRADDGVVRIFDREVSKGENRTDERAALWHEFMLDEAPDDALNQYDFLGDFSDLSDTPEFGEAEGNRSYHRRKARTASLLKWLFEG